MIGCDNPDCRYQWVSTIRQHHPHHSRNSFSPTHFATERCLRELRLTMYYPSPSRVLACSLSLAEFLPLAHVEFVGRAVRTYPVPPTLRQLETAVAGPVVLRRLPREIWACSQWGSGTSQRTEEVKGETREEWMPGEKEGYDSVLRASSPPLTMG